MFLRCALLVQLCALRFLRWHLAIRLKYNVFWWQMHNKNIKLNKFVVALHIWRSLALFTSHPPSPTLLLSAKSKRCPHLHLHFFRLTPQPHLIFLSFSPSLCHSEMRSRHNLVRLYLYTCVCVCVCWLIYGVDNNPAPASCDYEICNLCFVFCICFVVFGKRNQ